MFKYLIQLIKVIRNDIKLSFSVDDKLFKLDCIKYYHWCDFASFYRFQAVYMSIILIFCFIDRL